MPGTATRMSVPAAWKSSTPQSPSKIVIKLDFFKPFEGHNTAEFTMLPQGDATLVHLDDARARACSCPR